MKKSIPEKTVEWERRAVERRLVVSSDAFVLIAAAGAAVAFDAIVAASAGCHLVVGSTFPPPFAVALLFEVQLDVLDLPAVAPTSTNTILITIYNKV